MFVGLEFRSVTVHDDEEPTLACIHLTSRVRSGCCDCSVLHILDVDAYTGGERNRQHPLALASLGEMEKEPIAVVETSVLNKVSN